MTECQAYWFSLHQPKDGIEDFLAKWEIEVALILPESRNKAANARARLSNDDGYIGGPWLACVRFSDVS